MEELTCRLNLFHKTGHWDSRMEFLYVLYDVEFPGGNVVFPLMYLL
jgi:hypothetical protein